MRLRKEIDEMQERDILLIAKISDALAHPARIKIFRYIMAQNKKRERVCNKDLVNHFDYSQATISQHVKKLKDADLLQVKKQDRYSYYFVHLGTLNDLSLKHISEPTRQEAISIMRPFLLYDNILSLLLSASIIW